MSNGDLNEKEEKEQKKRMKKIKGFVGIQGVREKDVDKLKSESKRKDEGHSK